MNWCKVWTFLAAMIIFFGALGFLTSAKKALGWGSLFVLLYMMVVGIMATGRENNVF